MAEAERQEAKEGDEALKVTNPQFLKRPWLFALYTVIGGALPVYFGRPVTLDLGVIAIIAGVVAALNVWFYVLLKHTLNEQKRTGN